ncbi:MAG: hypothetical protein H6R42_209, partial [Nitrospirae bacterium]|nr:hypothetical protein [Nitrospirota bacterium]
PAYLLLEECIDCHCHGKVGFPCSRGPDSNHNVKIPDSFYILSLRFSLRYNKTFF